MNVKQIIIKYLKKNGYDGLCNCDAECGCAMDDICPWEQVNIEDCEPAYKRLVDGEELYVPDVNLFPDLGIKIEVKK